MVDTATSGCRLVLAILRAGLRRPARSRFRRLNVRMWTVGCAFLQVALPSPVQVEAKISRRLDLIPIHRFADGKTDASSDHRITGTLGMTRLLTFRFEPGRPKLSPDEEATIRSRAASPQFQEVGHEPTATLVVVGYIDRGADSHENEKVAFRRAQLLVDLLRDKCGVTAALQATTCDINRLPTGQQRDKQCVVEVWKVAP